jgi:hypothetical protein
MIKVMDRLVMVRTAISPEIGIKEICRRRLKWETPCTRSCYQSRAGTRSCIRILHGDAEGTGPDQNLCECHGRRPVTEIRSGMVSINWWPRTRMMDRSNEMNT